MKKDRWIQEIGKILDHYFPHPDIPLDYRDPYTLLIAVLLSAQCTDEVVNKVTPKLFERYRDVADFANANLEELQNMIRSTGFYRNKGKNIQATCRMIMEKFEGKVPRTMAELLELPGVARKTANVVLFNAFGIIDGVTVDTHVMRLSHRLGLSEQKTPEKIEKDLMKLFPQKEWGMLSHYLIFHGRRVCKAQRPNCAGCFLNKICPSAFSFDAKGKWVGPR